MMSRVPAGATTTQYVHLMELAKGGMGSVSVVVRQEGAFERVYALKRLHDSLVGEAAFEGMFLDEARIAGLIRHANVVSVLDVGRDDEGPYLLMELVEGLSLAAVIQHHRATRDPVPVQLALRIMRQVAIGLHAAHEQTDRKGDPLSIIHRDVSPSNILLGYDGVVRVTDFGVAKALGRMQRTATGVVKGKLGYMSPEQLAYEELGRRSDLFSLGVVLYELLTLERLYVGEEGARRSLTEAPPDIGEVREDVPVSVVALIFRLLAKAPKDRPETAGEVATELDAAIEECVQREGSIQVGNYVQRVFKERRSQFQESLSRALEEGPQTKSEGVPTQGSVASTAAHPLPRQRPEGGGLATAPRVLAIALATGALAALGIFMNTEPQPPPAPLPVSNQGSDVGESTIRSADGSTVDASLAVTPVIETDGGSSADRDPVPPATAAPADPASGMDPPPRAIVVRPERRPDPAPRPPRKLWEWDE